MKKELLLIGMLIAYPSMHADGWRETIKTKASHGITKIKEWGAVIPQLPQMTRDKFHKMAKDFWGHTPHLNKVAKVRTGLALSKGEKRALVHRKRVSQKAIEKQFGSSDYVPKIAFLASGGGYRAMLCTVGFLAGAQRAGLLDMITWMAGVSGGTWGIGAVLTKALRSKEPINISTFAQQFAQDIAGKTLMPSSAEIKTISNILLVQAVGHQLFTSINLYGALVANRIFSFLSPIERQRQRISDQKELIESGKWPIPIYTTAEYNPHIPIRDSNWVEFNPWEYGGTWLDSYAPIWGTSRRYNDGVSVNYHIERSFGFVLGMCGSAFAAQVDEIYEKIKGSLYGFVQNILERVIVSKYAKSRVAWGQLYNFSKGVSVSPIAKEDYLNLLDAGLAINLPYPPVSGQRPERTPDILIMMDASATIPDSLHLIERYAQRNKLKLPPISYKGIASKSISVFQDDKDPSVPVVIYIPRINDASLHDKAKFPALAEYEKWIKGFDVDACTKSGSCNTFNFNYSTDAALKLIKLMEFQTIANRSVIFDAIQKVIDTKGKSWWQIWK